MIGQTLATETPVETVLRARRLGIGMCVEDDGTIRVSLPPGIAEAPSWLKAAKARDVEALAFAVALVSAVGRGGGDPAALLNVSTLVIAAVQ